ncbi:hypothetical protein [Limnohabitans curvus]|jgi:hypothetical protein|uniref:hypothetical protein n=1 Tax=Limnohabitans curvus TaxID=323423 RepID=UPI0011B2117D|nr:hypothetical protein [Limnohabitans curvus]
MKNRIMNFLGNLHGVEHIPQQMVSGHPSCMLISSGQIFSLPPGHESWGAEDFDSFAVGLGTPNAFTLRASKVIRLLLTEHARLVSADLGTSIAQEFKDIKKHLEVKTGYAL